MTADTVLDITMDYLKDTPAGGKIQMAVAAVDLVQKDLYALAASSDEDHLTVIKAGTVLLFSVLTKIAEGKDPQKFTSQDWMSIAKEVSDKAVLMDGQSYSNYVFSLYARYIDFWAEFLKGRIPDTSYKAIKSLVKDLEENERSLQNGKVTETVYVENCLWICLDAMVKLLSSWIGISTGKTLSQLIQAASAFSFEYARYVLYRNEQQILTEYLSNQKVLDAHLESKLDAYKQQLNIESQQFMELINNAFDSDIRERLSASAALAHAAGVADNDILTTTEDVDDFFLN